MSYVLDVLLVWRGAIVSPDPYGGDLASIFVCADLRAADLTEGDFASCIFVGARHDDANLRGANFFEAGRFRAVTTGVSWDHAIRSSGR